MGAPPAPLPAVPPLAPQAARASRPARATTRSSLRPALFPWSLSMSTPHPPNHRDLAAARVSHRRARRCLAGGGDENGNPPHGPTGEATAGDFGPSVRAVL